MNVYRVTLTNGRKYRVTAISERAARAGIDRKIEAEGIKAQIQNVTDITDMDMGD